MVYKSNIYYFKIYQKRNQNNIQFPLERKKIQSPWHLAQLSIWKGRIGFLDIDTKLNSLKIKWIQRLLNTTNALSKDLMLYPLNLILDSNQGLALFRQKQIFRSNRHRNLQKQNNENFFIQLLNAWLHFTNNNFPTPTSIEEIIDQPIFKPTHQTGL